jgi:RNA polymerase sigma factor (sigma-70 family)
VSPLLRLQSDDRLSKLAAEGFEPAFETLVRRHRRVVEAATRRVLPRDGAEDAAQQAMLSAHQALIRNGPPDRFEPWLRRIALNAALKEASRHDDDTIPIDEESVDGVEQPDEAHERRERLSRTVGAVAGLPARQRRALVMRELEGRSHEEIAKQLGLSRGAIRQLIHRARDGVRSVATVLTPLALLRAGPPGLGSGQASEIAAGGITAGIGAKAAATVLVTGGIAGGVALAPIDKGSDDRRAQATPAKGSDSGAILSDDSGSDSGSSGSSGRGRSGEGRSGDEGSGKGRGRGRGRGGDSSGEGSSGQGRGRGRGGSDSSGSGSSGSGSSGSGSSGSGSSGSGSSGSGSSGSGSDSSGSGSSGSGSGGDEPDPPDLD